MPRAQQCIVCGSPATVKTDGGFYVFIDCRRCGEFQLGRALADDLPQMRLSNEQRALASHHIRKRQGAKRTILDEDFFESLASQSLPTPAELSDNLLLTIVERVGGRPGKSVSVDNNTDVALEAAIGALDKEDVLWAIRNLEEQKLVIGQWASHFSNGHLTAAGWARVEELKLAHVASRYAFFARKFANNDLDTLYDECLKQAVADAGFELRTVTQKAGHIDAIIEDEIRRCRFLIADLSDDNAGAYWEAGLAEGLGKDVIYLCREGVRTHFDTDHRHTVRWDLSDPDGTAKRLKAVIRNTLLGDARHED
jgi:nucleoside 2-deoxyribosyltransferase